MFPVLAFFLTNNESPAVIVGGFVSLQLHIKAYAAKRKNIFFICSGLVESKLIKNI